MSLLPGWLNNQELCETQSGCAAEHLVSLLRFAIDDLFQEIFATEDPNWAIFALNDSHFATEYPNRTIFATEYHNWAIFVNGDPNFATEYPKQTIFAMNDPNLNIAIKYYNWAIFATDDPEWGTFSCLMISVLQGPPLLRGFLGESQKGGILQ